MLIRKVHCTTKQSKERTLLVKSDDRVVKVFLRKSKFHCMKKHNSRSRDCDSRSRDCDSRSRNCDSRSRNCDEDKFCTSKMYTVMNLGSSDLTIVAADGDKINGHKEICLVLSKGENVTLQNYKNTFFIVSKIQVC